MMAILPSSFFFFFVLLLFLAHTRTSFGSICENTSCQSTGVSIGFPFWLSEVNQSSRCAYPGFELACNGRNQPLLTLPQESGDVVVKFISYQNQKVWVNDPDECLPRRFLINRGLRLEGSPFLLADEFSLVNYSFLNCPNNLTSLYRLPTISCLSSNIKNLNYSVLALLSDPPFSVPWTSSCQLITSALVPVAQVGSLSSLFWTVYLDDIQLQWNNPDCGFCEANGGQCGLLGDTSLRVACYNLPSQGPSRKVKYGVSIGLGIPALLVTIGIAVFMYRKMKMHDQRRQAMTEFSSSIIPHPPVVVMGLDGAIVERYPITQLGESGRLPRPNDNICSICLSEYQPKEVLRTIPECNHYFHANCIDGWLKMNATCPLCRNLPERSSSSIPSSLPFSPTSQ